MEELRIAGKQLRAALDRYLSVCTSIHNLCSNGGIRNITENHLDNIKAELLHFPTYEPKLSEAWAAITKTRNNLAQFAPINTLPSEILTQIFYTVLGSEPCPFNLRASEDMGSETSSGGIITPYLDVIFPRYPDYLAQVCTRWRQIALSSPTLWVHIDFTPHIKIHKGLLVRADTHAARANSLPLIVHIYEGKQTDYDEDQVISFLASIAHRTKALDFTIINCCGYFTATVFETLLPRCTSEPSAFTRLAMTLIGNQPKPRFKSGDDGGAYRSQDLILDLPQPVIEQSLSHISVLQLRGIFLDWSSTVYRGLVDLRLVSSSNLNWDSIPESNLRTILESNPRLRVLHFAIEITDKTPEGSPVTPVRLDDLEVVNISTYRGDREAVLDPGGILRLLAPGLQPTRLSMWHWGYSYDNRGFTLEELSRFFQRSNVTKFRAKGGCPPLDKLLCHAPNLEDLALDSCIPTYFSEERFENDNPRAKPLNCLIVHHCSSTPNQLEMLLEQYPSKLLIVSGHPVPEDVELVKQMLSEKYPDTEILVYNDRSLDPFDDWDLIH
ncbi:hypothetical protein FRC11_006517 [Ceratobasidium sp. 423]|nr:hypothetical protein FRC11_006517 [Ceratobasidium sp. 423]